MTSGYNDGDEDKDDGIGGKTTVINYDLLPWLSMTSGYNINDDE